MVKRLVVSLTVAGSLLVTTSAAPVAAGAAKGCPPGFLTATTAPGVDPDRNMNGIICLKITPGGKLILIDDRAGGAGVASRVVLGG